MDPREGRPRSTLLQRFLTDLRRDRRKRTVLLVLLPLLVIAWIPVLTGGDDVAAPALAVGDPGPDPAPHMVSSTTPVDPALRAELEGLVEQIEQPWTPSWTAVEDEAPFTVPLPTGGRAEPAATGDGTVQNAEQEQELATTLTPTCTFLSKTRGNLVVIAGRPYRRGDIVEHFVIREIGARAVVLEGRFGEYELRIPLRDGEQ